MTPAAHCTLRNWGALRAPGRAEQAATTARKGH